MAMAGSPRPSAIPTLNSPPLSPPSLFYHFDPSSVACHADHLLYLRQGPFAADERSQRRAEGLRVVVCGGSHALVGTHQGAASRARQAQQVPRARFLLREPRRVVPRAYRAKSWA